MLKTPINIEEYGNYTNKQLLECHKYSFNRLKKINTMIPKEYREILMNVPRENIEYIESVLKSRKIAIPNYNSTIRKIMDKKHITGISVIILLLFIIHMLILR
ncbi:hypothetical protein CDLVIII_4308 [Clostridium sp. DL-VIII]|uniref:hypothetical protein n=1 Tax=Clostridium sp. DL-VIII TaxID=641107 RepID=UPI00023B052D|nr:hypothetical protein [Clostridium sp. DL-VIII]EHJ00824.1 hypothetical protein CDLVIII_4308 [Clostridium sp. DL-VIII]